MKKLRYLLPAIYVFAIIVDIGFDLTDYQLLVALLTPPMWSNFFQGSIEKGIIAVVISVVIWYLIGLVIDTLINKIKSRKQTNLV